MDLQELIDRAHDDHTRVVGAPSSGRTVGSVVCDSRLARPASLFCCVRGSTVDGHDYAERALDAGAVALLVDHEISGSQTSATTQVVVADTRVAAGRFASAFHDYPSNDLRVAGVTGTNGKTTVTFLLESIARARGGVPGVIGTIATRYADVQHPSTHTTPDQCQLQELFAEMRTHGVTDVAMEVSSHALDQARVAGTRFSVVCFTNLGQDHLDYHGTIEAYGEAKAALFRREYADLAAINTADPFGAHLARTARDGGLDVWTYGGPGADVVLSGVTYAPDRTVMQISCSRRGWDFELVSPLVGGFNTDNVLCAVTAELARGTAPDAIIAGIAATPLVPGRIERVTEPGARFSVFVDYAHTADALDAVTSALRVLVPDDAQLWVVYGCGGDRDASKRPAMAAAVARGADQAVLTSDNPRSEAPEAIIADARRGIGVHDPQPHVEVDRRRAIEWALTRAAPGDVVIIAGKGHETGQDIGGVVQPFDDRVVAREILQGLR